MKSVRQLLRRNPIRYGPFIALYSVLAVALAVFDVLLTRQSGALGQGAVDADLGAIAAGMAAMALLTLGKLVFGALAALVSGRYAGRAAYALRAAFARHFSAIGYKALSRFKSGDILSIYGNELPRVIGMLSEEMPPMIGEAAMLLVAGGFMAAIHPLYTLIFFAAFPVLMLMQVAISGPIQPLVAEASKRRGEYNAVVLDSLQNTSAIAAYSLGDRMEGRYGGAYESYFRAQLKRIKVFGVLIISGIMATFLPNIFIAVASALSVANGSMTFGQFLALTLMAESAGQFLSMLSQRLSSLRTGLANAQRLEENTRGEGENLDGALGADGGGDAIVFDHVTFAYDEDAEPALRDVSFSIARGESVALVGASGSGKSTAAKLMQTLYAPDEGSVRILGRDEKTSPKAPLRELIASVPQESFLFPESIRANIAMTADPAMVDEARLTAAAAGAGIHDFIAALPGGYDTVLAEGGENLSGGQRQRVAIARALYREAPVLLLDEATSALDPSTERSVLAALAGAARGRTTVVVAHRLAAIADCDRILVLEGGRLIEQGTFDELMAGDTAFAALYRRQREEEAQ